MYVRYVCSNCGKNTKENGILNPRQCALCTRVICHHCSPKGFCETCTTSIPENDKKILNRTFTQRKVFVGIIWLFIIVGFASIAMFILAGGETFQINYPFAETLQTVFMIIGLVVFFGLFIIAIISVRLSRKVDATLSDVANNTRLKAQQTGVPIRNVGLITDYEVLRVKTETERHLGSAPRYGVTEVVQFLIEQKLTPENPNFLEHVKGSVAAKYRKASDPGRAIISFLVIATFMEKLSLVQGSPFSTLDKLPPNVSDFMYAVIRMQNVSNIAKKIIYGI